jgi:hypothetical protein
VVKNYPHDPAVPTLSNCTVKGESTRPSETLTNKGPQPATQCHNPCDKGLTKMSCLDSFHFNCDTSFYADCPCSLSNVTIRLFLTEAALAFCPLRVIAVLVSHAVHTRTVITQHSSGDGTGRLGCWLETTGINIRFPAEAKQSLLRNATWFWGLATPQTNGCRRRFLRG